MSAPRLKNALVIAVGLALAGLGVANLVLKASFTLIDDGAFWRQTAQGLVAARVAPGGPADQAGVREARRARGGRRRGSPELEPAREPAGR